MTPSPRRIVVASSPISCIFRQTTLGLVCQVCPNSIRENPTDYQAVCLSSSLFLQCLQPKKRIRHHRCRAILPGVSTGPVQAPPLDEETQENKIVSQLPSRGALKGANRSPPFFLTPPFHLPVAHTNSHTHNARHIPTPSRDGTTQNPPSALFRLMKRPGLFCSCEDGI